MKLLIVDDDQILSEVVAEVLAEEGYAVFVAADCAQARALHQSDSFDALILDVVLPDGTGFDLLSEFRSRGAEVPVLMLTSLDTAEDVIRGLDAGADDYLTKPFQPAVLAARVRALLRRSSMKGPEKIQRGPLEVDRLARSVTVHGRNVRLTPKEFGLLEHLLIADGRVVNRTELLEKVWNLTFDPGSNVVDAHLARLRGKLTRAGAGSPILTVRGGGFRIPLENEATADRGQTPAAGRE